MSVLNWKPVCITFSDTQKRYLNTLSNEVLGSQQLDMKSSLNTIFSTLLSH